MGQTFPSQALDQSGIELANLVKRPMNRGVNPKVPARFFAVSKVDQPVHFGKNRGRRVGFEVGGWAGRFWFGSVVLGGHYGLNGFRF